MLLTLFYSSLHQYDTKLKTRRKSAKIYDIRRNSKEILQNTILNIKGKQRKSDRI